MDADSLRHSDQDVFNFIDIVGGEQMYKLLCSTNRNLDPFLTRFGRSVRDGTILPVEVPVEASIPLSDWIGNLVRFSNPDYGLFSVIPRNISRKECRLETGFGKTAVVQGICIETNGNEHILYDGKISFV